MGLKIKGVARLPPFQLYPQGGSLPGEDARGNGSFATLNQPPDFVNGGNERHPTRSGEPLLARKCPAGPQRAKGGPRRGARKTVSTADRVGPARLTTLTRGHGYGNNHRDGDLHVRPTLPADQDCFRPGRPKSPGRRITFDDDLRPARP